MGKLSDIVKILQDASLLNKLRKLPNKVESLEKRIEVLETSKLSENIQLQCVSCFFSPIDVKTLRRRDNGRILKKSCPNCGDKWEEHPDEKPPSQTLTPKSKYIT